METMRAGVRAAVRDEALYVDEQRVVVAVVDRHVLERREGPAALPRALVREDTQELPGELVDVPDLRKVPRT